jgi:drug/metabolite transporter (DMT)-like permease
LNTRGGTSTIRRARWDDLALLLLLAAIWSSSFMFIKVAVLTVPPLTLAVMRLALAAALLGAYAWRAGVRIQLTPQVLFAFAFVGCFGNALPFTLIGWGEQTVSSGLAAILMGAMPLVTLILAHHLIQDEPFQRRRLLGLLIGLTGLAILVGWDALSDLGGAWVAQMAILGGAVSYAVNTVFTRRNLHIPGTILAAGAVTAGMLMLLPLALLLEQPWKIQPTSSALWSIVALGVLSTALATLLYFHLLRAIGATAFSQVNHMIPIMGVLWGTLFLGERPGFRDLLALTLILIGVWLVNHSAKRV